MSDITRMFIDDSRAFLNGDYLPKIESCLEVLTDEDVWWRPNEESNSIGNLLLHLEGSTRGWIINMNQADQKMAHTGNRSDSIWDFILEELKRTGS